METLTDKQIIEYFHRSFKAVDGLWFMKMEEKHGFDTALETDEEVWKVMPKIQVRMIKSMLSMGEEEKDLLRSLTTKLTLEGFRFKVEQKKNGFQIQIKGCPWHELMLKSGRQKFSGRVGTAVCGVEYSTWASQFDASMTFTLKKQICAGSKHCTLNFERRSKLPEKQTEQSRQ